MHGLCTALIDGRNRLKACEIAGVEPRFVQLNGQDDPTAFIISANIARRHMTRGAMAMIVAQVYPDSDEKRGRGKKSSVTEHFPMVSSGKLSQARTVLSYAPKLAPNVISGAMSLDQAYNKAKGEKAATENDEAKLAELRKTAPDLADLVVEERISLAAALKEIDEREARHSARPVAPVAQGRVRMEPADSLPLYAGHGGIRQIIQRE